ncbi:MAG: hypothetical protein ING69_10815 [Rhodocyclaceae bacterium]|nr:hypothetical protein [Rhodocyclaceae bacterium]
MKRYAAQKLFDDEFGAAWRAAKAGPVSIVVGVRAIRYATELDIFRKKDSDDAVSANKLLGDLGTRKMTAADRDDAGEIWQNLTMLSGKQQDKVARLIAEAYDASGK